MRERRREPYLGVRFPLYSGQRYNAGKRLRLLPGREKAAGLNIKIIF